MPLTDAEILELETLLKIEGLSVIDADTNKNYIMLHENITHQQYNASGQLIEGKRGAGLEGSSRSGKTWAGVDIVMFICLYLEETCVINIIKETYNEFKTTLYNDFKQRMEYFNLPHPFDNQEVKSFKIGKNKINFIGADKKAGKFHGAQCDYLWLNEPLNIAKTVFDQAEMRCKKFWWFDYNPSVTEHFIFNSILTRPDIGFLRTTFLDNPKLSIQERNKILSYEPWLPGSYEVVDSVIMYKGKEVGKDNVYPPAHPTNLDYGTADEFMWKVYGLGLRGAMQGVIFNNVVYIDAFPSDISYIHANDFGFTTDPNALVKYAEDAKNIFIELLSYEPIETPAALAAYMDALGIDKSIPLPCDSADKYTGTNGTVEMVTGLKRHGYNAYKISKTKTVMVWLNSMKTKKVHIVRNHLFKHAKTEAENYRIREINGTPINEPLDAFNHMWDAARYGHIAYNNKPIHHITEQSLSELGIDF